MPEEDVILYAIWTPTTYTITYNSTLQIDGQIQEASEEVNVIDAVYLDEMFTLDGYTLNGWVYNDDEFNFGEKIGDGTPQEIQNNAAVIDAYLGRADEVAEN